jgi:hypothetical protein
MKRLICLLAGALALTPPTTVFCQPSASPPQSPMRIMPRSLYGVQETPAADTNVLTRFSIDFPGGTPAQLAAAIHKSMGEPLNVIIPTEDADTQLPPLKMNDVTAPQLFAALEAASRKNVAVTGGGPFGGYTSYSQVTTYYGFRTSDSPVKDSSIWYFHAEKPSLPAVISSEKICRFYSLAPYLDRGFTVDDITTAIQTGWKMSGDITVPELKYHKETKLLIAFGEPDKLATIESVLKTLPASNATRTELDNMQSAIDHLQKELKIVPLPIRSNPPQPAAPPQEKPGK